MIVIFYQRPKSALGRLLVNRDWAEIWGAADAKEGRAAAATFAAKHAAPNGTDALTRADDVCD
jgi:hypothetical protein